MDIKVYGAPGCSVCKSACQFLEQNNINYEYIDVGTDITIDKFKEKFNVTTVPIIIVDDRTFYGFSPIMKDLIKEKAKTNQQK